MTLSVILTLHDLGAVPSDITDDVTICPCRWWDDKRTCDDVSNTRSTQQEFGLEHMAGVFIVGLLGLGAALTLFLVKKLYFLARGVHSDRGGSNGEKSSEQTLQTPPTSREKEKLCQSNTSLV